MGAGPSVVPGSLIITLIPWRRAACLPSLFWLNCESSALHVGRHMGNQKCPGPSQAGFLPCGVLPVRTQTLGAGKDGPFQGEALCRPPWWILILILAWAAHYLRRYPLHYCSTIWKLFLPWSWNLPSSAFFPTSYFGNLSQVQESEAKKKKQKKKKSEAQA